MNNTHPTISQMAMTWPKLLFQNLKNRKQVFPSTPPPLIKKYQDTDKQLKLLVQRTNGKDFATKKVEDVELITL
jgi:hypothetical protein